jgi:hypothetical protein
MMGILKQENHDAPRGQMVSEERIKGQVYILHKYGKCRRDPYVSLDPYVSPDPYVSLSPELRPTRLRESNVYKIVHYVRIQDGIGK